jgi:hypothetical protein
MADGVETFRFSHGMVVESWSLFGALRVRDVSVASWRSQSRSHGKSAAGCLAPATVGRIMMIALNSARTGRVPMAPHPHHSAASPEASQHQRSLVGPAVARAPLDAPRLYLAQCH